MAFSSPTNSLTLPTGATTGTPRIVFNSAIPAELLTKYPDGGGIGIASCTLWYPLTDDSLYYYQAVLQYPAIVTGWVHIGGTTQVIEQSRTDWTSTQVWQRWQDYGASPYKSNFVFGDSGLTDGQMVINTSVNGGLIVAGVTPLKVAGDQVTAACENASSELSGATNTTSGSFAVVPGSSSVSFTKRYAGSALEYAVHGSGYCSVAANSGVEYGVRVSNAVPFSDDRAVGVGFFNQLSVHMPFSSIRRSVNAIPAGTYTAQLIWRRYAGTGQINADNNDTWSMNIREVF